MFGATWKARVPPDASDMTTESKVVFTLTTVPVVEVVVAGTSVARETVGTAVVGGAPNVLVGEGAVVAVGDAPAASVGVVALGTPGVAGRAVGIDALGDGTAVVVPFAAD